MDSGIKPISVSTTFSIALHALLVFAVLQTQQVMHVAGSGIEIELVSSTFVSAQDETERAASQAESSPDSQRASETVVGNAAEIPVSEPGDNNLSPREKAVRTSAADADSIATDSGEQVSTRSTNASGQRESLIELLHAKISEHKQYPYLARRQRREGVATVEFVLHPDGSVVNPRLLQSSRTTLLDRAALDAVKSIEPFTPAGSFIDRPEAYRVDVVFNVM